MYSDCRLKYNIKNLSHGLEILKKLRPVSFNYKSKLSHIFGSENEYGFIAQDVQKVLPDLVRNGEIIKVDSSEFRSLYLKTENMIPIIINSIINLDSRIESRSINYSATTAHIPAAILALDGFTLNPADLLSIRGPLFYGTEGFTSYIPNVNGIVAQIQDPLRKIKTLSPIKANGIPVLIPEQIESQIPEAVFEFKGKKSIDLSVLICYIIAAIKQIK